MATGAENVKQTVDLAKVHGALGTAMLFGREQRFEAGSVTTVSTGETAHDFALGSKE